MKKILIIILLMVMSACSKKEGMTSSKIKLFSGSHSSLLSTKSNNGMVLYGKSLDGKVFTKKINNDMVDLILPNGTWNFYAISWEAPSNLLSAMPNFIGKTYCGKSLAQSLVGTDVSISIDITNASCADTEFSAYSSVQTIPTTEVILPRPNIINCKDVNGITSLDITKCDQNLAAKFNKGYATSYKIVAYEYANFGSGNILPPIKIAESACVRTDFSTLTGLLNATDAANFANVHIPTTVGKGLAAAIQVFYSGGTTAGTPTGCDPSLGMDEIPLTPGPRVKVLADTLTTPVGYNVFVQTNAVDTCRAPRLAPGNFAAGFGTPGSPYAICTKEQFTLLSSSFSTYMTSSFDLLTDINFGMISMSPIGDPLLTSGGSATNSYSGTFNGQNHKLSNVLINCRLPGVSSLDNNDVGLFRKLTEATVKNLTLNTAVVNCKSGNNIGILAGSLSNTSINNTLENLKIHGHAEGLNYIGGVAGYALKNGSSTLNVSYVHVSGDFGGSQWVGGLFGYAQGTTGIFAISRSSFRGSLHANSNSSNGIPVLSYAGGLIGQAFGPALSLSEVVVRNAQVEGSTTVGGFAGASSNVSISNSYVEAILKTFGSTNGTTTFSDLGGAVGNATGGTFTNVLAAYGTKEWSGMNMIPLSADTSIGGLIGRGSATCSAGSFFTGVKHVNNTVACGAQIALTTAHTQTNYSVLASWDFTTTPVWTMPDESNDIPRLAFETAVNPASGIIVENEVPYLKRLCHGNYANIGQPNPTLICTEAQLRASLNSAVTTTLGRNIYYPGTAYSFQPFPAGVYHLNGAGFGLYNFSFALTSLTTGEGIFKDLQAGSVISNLDIAGAKVLGTGLAAYNGASAGIFAGINSGVISNVNIYASSIEFLNSTIDNSTASNISFIGGMVGKNTITGIIKLSELSPTVRIQDPTLLTGTLYAGGVAALNRGLILGVRSYGQLERIVNCPSTALAISLPSGEMDGVFVGLNEGTVSEVEANGRMRFQLSGAFTNCSLGYNGMYSPFIAINNTGAFVHDFIAEGAFDSSMGGTNTPAPELVAINWGTISRGFLTINSFDANKIMPQIRPATVNWNAQTNTPALTVATCAPAGAGTSYTVTSASASSFVGPVAVGDIIMCRNGIYAALPMEAKNHVTTNPLPMTNVFYSVTKPTTGIPTLDAGRYFNTDLTYSSNGIGGLSINYLVTTPLLVDDTWNVGTDFFASTGKTWLLDYQMGNNAGTPQLVKTGGNVDQLGPPF